MKCCVRGEARAEEGVHLIHGEFTEERNRGAFAAPLAGQAQGVLWVIQGGAQGIARPRQMGQQDALILLPAVQRHLCTTRSRVQALGIIKPVFVFI